MLCKKKYLGMFSGLNFFAIRQLLRALRVWLAWSSYTAWTQYVLPKALSLRLIMLDGVQGSSMIRLIIRNPSFALSWFISIDILATPTEDLFPCQVPATHIVEWMALIWTLGFIIHVFSQYSQSSTKCSDSSRSTNRLTRLVAKNIERWLGTESQIRNPFLVHSSYF